MPSIVLPATFAALACSTLSCQPVKVACWPLAGASAAGPLTSCRRGERNRSPACGCAMRRIGTSGAGEQFVLADGRRYGHVLDPPTGWPAEGVLSASRRLRERG